MRTRFLLPALMAAAILCAAVSPLLQEIVQAQGTILFRAPYGATDWNRSDDAWWEQNDAFGLRWTSAWLPGLGPQGQNVVQLTELAGSGQHGWGWHGHVIPDLPAGGVRYFRFRHRVLSCLRSTSNKLLIVAQGCQGGRCRVIIETRCNGAGMVQYNFQVDGGVFHKETGYLYPTGSWHSVQLEVRAQSASGATDGRMREWVDNDNPSAPTIDSGPIALDNGGTEGSYVIFGGYNNNDSWPAGFANIQQYTDFEIATAFDSGWHGASGPQVDPPTAPTNVRLVP